MPMKNYPLGFGYGGIMENEEKGTVSYRPSGGVFPAFTVKISDVRAVSENKIAFGQCMLKIHGQGTTLAEFKVRYGVAEKVRAWFEEHGKMNQSTAKESSDQVSLSDELNKLKQLHESGTLDDNEFSEAKKKIIAKFA
jgi:hypothetical protein